MAGAAPHLLFEGFLHKRKDTLRMRWVKYWFRLQNTTLFFYTKKNGSACHLRGCYYLYTVQAVREVHPAADSRGFLFQIIMTSGKTKVLAAETDALRRAWLGHLWQAMYLSTSVFSGRRSSDVPCERSHVSAAAGLHGDGVVGRTCCRPRSAPSHSHGTLEPQRRRDIVEGGGLCGPEARTGSSGTRGERQGDSDVLPLRRGPSADVEAVYDIPPSRRRPAEPQENVYDVPSRLARKLSDVTIGDDVEKFRSSLRSPVIKCHAAGATDDTPATSAQKTNTS